MAQKWLKQLQASNAENAINTNSQYNDIDADGDGKLTAKELAQSSNITILEAEELIEQYDANGDGTLDASEFEELKQQILSQQRNNMTDKININQNYNDFDKDGDGRLDANEFAQACNISIQEAQNIIYQYDANGDGTLDANEFEDLKQQILAQQRNVMTDALSNNENYNDIDINNDGKLTAYELAQACNITELEAKNVILQYDANGDGMLDQNEFEDLKSQILAQKDEMQQEEYVQQTQEQEDDNSNSSNEQEEQKQQEYVTPSGVSINADIAAYQSAVYDNNSPMIAMNNSNGRDNSNSAFIPYNQQNNAPKYSGNIDKIDDSEYDVNNSNAKAFGVDIFGNENNNNKSDYNNTNTSNNNNTNPSPFGQKNQNNSAANSSPFGKKVSPFGQKNDNSNVNVQQNDRPFGQKNQNNETVNSSPFGQKVSPFGKKPDSDNSSNNQNKPVVSNNDKPKYKHQWVLGIKFDPQRQEIILNVGDDTTGKKWRKIVTKQECYGDIKQEYFRLGNIMNNGDAKYTAPQNDIGAVQVELSKADNRYDFYAQSV